MAGPIQEQYEAQHQHHLNNSRGVVVLEEDKLAYIFASRVVTQGPQAGQFDVLLLECNVDP